MNQSLLKKFNKQVNFITDDQIDKEEQFLIEDLKRKKSQRKQFQKVSVGTQSGFDMAQFFKFKKKGEPSESIIDDISGGHLAWLVLIYGVFNNSMVIPWMISIGANKFLRLAWRHSILNFIIVPFMLYEYRTGNDKVKEQYKFWNIIKKQHLKKIYLVALIKSIWFIVVTTAFQYTSISHGLILGTLMNFFLSINRSLGNSVHYLQPGGQILVVVGILIIVKDVIFMDETDRDSKYDYMYYLDKQWYIRLIADIISLSMSGMMAYASRFTSDIGQFYPSYLGMMLANFMVTFNMVMASYFFHGATFDQDQIYGIFSIFRSDHFNMFFCMCIFLGCGMFLSYAMISNLFPQPLLPSLAALFEPIISIMMVDIISVQEMPSGYAFMGFIFIIPGMFLILVGQYIFQKAQKQQQKKEEDKIKAIKELKISRINSRIKRELNSSEQYCSQSPKLRPNSLVEELQREKRKKEKEKQQKLIKESKSCILEEEDEQPLQIQLWNIEQQKNQTHKRHGEK